MNCRLLSLLLIPTIALTMACKVSSNGGQPGGDSNHAKVITEAPPGNLTMIAFDFHNGAAIPKKFSCDGANISPALIWDLVPEGVKSFALIVDDPDAPHGKFTHWVMYNIPGTDRGLAANIERVDSLPNSARQGLNGTEQIGYFGPCPPPGKPHRYIFHLFALNTTLSFPTPPNRDKLQAAMQGHILTEAQTIGTYQK